VHFASVADAPMYLLTGAAAIFSNDHPTNGSHAKYILEQRQGRKIVFAA
jgi:hypothetical protein